MNGMVPTFDIPASAHRILPELADPRAARHLVTIHGIADTPDVWQPVCRALDSRFRSYNQLSLKWHAGVGEPYSYPECGEVLRKGWAQLPEGPKVILAHSFGSNALMSMIQSQRLPDVDAVVMLSPYYKTDYSAFSWPLFVRYVNEFERFLNTSIDARMPGRTLSPAARETILNRLLDGYSPSSWVMFFMAWSQTPKLDLSALDMPCAVMTGADDFSLPVEDVAALAARIPGARFEALEGLNHFALIEDAARTAARISDFLTTTLSTPELVTERL
ncbi:Pimeloyl-ACP methyl ester carboxylesterase [Monaibacterium marinum]|uniref:Pimeloyl-ACP methyl ester carboxylesterase n=1 Tax=Pontivivens marinum TaxID=1690039 RepID=A0A2C9CUP7_9RHOB|nr:alpha/beta hydrolase [Monaibacterium marinum]SOH94992.1 Pimeloyl-ACP methyl ester carboxylesterase [Monaibacterium marinum]